MCSTSLYTGLVYMGGMGSCEAMKIIFGSVIKKLYTTLNINFGPNQTFRVLKTPVYLFDVYLPYPVNR